MIKFLRATRKHIVTFGDCLHLAFLATRTLHRHVRRVDYLSYTITLLGLARLSASHVVVSHCVIDFIVLTSEDNRREGLVPLFLVVGCPASMSSTLA